MPKTHLDRRFSIGDWGTDEVAHKAALEDFERFAKLRPDLPVAKNSRGNLVTARISLRQFTDGEDSGWLVRLPNPGFNASMRIRK